MAADTTYQPAIRRLQGGNTLESSTAGTIDSYGAVYNRSGGTLYNQGTLTSTGTITNSGTLTNSGTIANTGAITNTGTITNSSDGKIVDTVTANVAAATLVNYGISSIGSTTAGARAYKLPRAPQGTHKYLHVQGCTAGGITVVSATAAGSTCFFLGTKTKITAKTAAARGLMIHLIAATSKIWGIVGYSTAAGTYTCT